MEAIDFIFGTQSNYSNIKFGKTHTPNLSKTGIQ
jgi:hypothetical protein